MVRSAAPILFIVLLAATIVVVDVLFFRGDRFWARLMANAGIVLVYCAFYLRLLNK